MRGYLQHPELSLQALQDREQAVRRRAEEVVRSEVPLTRRPLFGWVLGRARRHIRERENMRFARTRVFGTVRRLFRALGDHLVRRGLLQRRPDVFYLTLDELLGFVEGTTATVDLAGLVAVRQAEYEQWRAAKGPHRRFETVGPLNFANPFTVAHAPTEQDQSPDLLRGIGCAPGVVRAEARVVHDPTAEPDLQGRILVTERTDPGWVPLFLSAGGLLVERGSALSHSAIVAREFGVPTVVGLPGLLQRVNSGDTVELDGAAGTVRLRLDADGATDDAAGQP